MTLARKTAVLIIALLLAAACCMQIQAAYSGDKTWLLFAAEQWLSGHRLYTAIVEVNPPLIVWLYAFPVWLAKHAGAADDKLLGVLGLLACALSVAFSNRVLRLHPAFASRAQDRRITAWFLAAIFIFFTSPVYFFDREHILLVLAFPYMLRFMPSLAKEKFSVPLRWGIGVCAAVAFCIKPYTIVVFAIIQLLAIGRRQGSVILASLENIVIYCCAIAYLASVWLITPEYVHTVLPMALATYWAFSRRLLGLFYAIAAFLMAGVSFADFRWRDQSPYRQDIVYFIGIVSAYLLYALLNNGWGYTYHPLLSTLLFLSGWLYLHYRWLAGMPGAAKRFTFGMRACLLVVGLNAVYMLYGLAVFFITPACQWSAECAKNQPYARYLQDHRVRSFGALTEDFHKWAALSRMAQVPLVTRYNALWMVPALVQDAADMKLRDARIRQQVGRDLAEDLDIRQPEILFVDDERNFFGLGKTLFLPDFFASVPAFAQAWSHYAYVDRIDRCSAGKPPAGCRHSIYRRLP